MQDLIPDSPDPGLSGRPGALQSASIRGLKDRRAGVKILATMKRLTRHRVFAALMVLALAIGVPLRGTATPARAALPATADFQVPGECDGCADGPSEALDCPTLSCPGVGAVLSLGPRLDSSRQSFLGPWGGDLEVGLSSAPEPHPPRRHIR